MMAFSRKGLYNSKIRALFVDLTLLSKKTIGILPRIMIITVALFFPAAPVKNNQV